MTALSVWSAPRILFQGPAKPAEPSTPPSRPGRARGRLRGGCRRDPRRGRGAWTPRRVTCFGFAPPRRSRLSAAFGLRPRSARDYCARAARAGRPLPEGLAFHLGTGLASPASLRRRDPRGGTPGRRARRPAASPSESWMSAAASRPACEARRDARGRVRGRPASPEAFLRAIRSALRRSVPGARLLLEPGRAVASDAFHLVTRVVRTTARRVYVDASRMSHAFFVPRGHHVFRPIPQAFRRGQGGGARAAAHEPGSASPAARTSGVRARETSSSSGRSGPTT